MHPKIKFFSLICALEQSLQKTGRRTKKNRALRIRSAEPRLLSYCMFQGAQAGHAFLVLPEEASTEDSPDDLPEGFPEGFSPEGF